MRTFFETSSIGILYSDDFTFSTLPLPEPPCEITEGVIDFDFFNMDMADLTIDPTSDDYKMGTSCDLGDLDFTFAAEPKTGIYKTVGPTSYLSPDEVRVDGILGGTFSCYYGGYSDEGLYVINDGNGNISIAFSDMNMSTSMSCSSYSAAGEVHN